MEKWNDVFACQDPDTAYLYCWCGNFAANNLPQWEKRELLCLGFLSTVKHFCHLATTYLGAGAAAGEDQH